MNRTRKLVGTVIWLAAVWLTACVRPSAPYEPFAPNSGAENTPGESNLPFTLPTRDPSQPLPTPDAPHALPTLRAEPIQYTVKSGDTLGSIARAYQIPMQRIIAENQIANPNLINPGQTFIIPAPIPDGTASGFKMIPDSELVFSPTSALLDLETFIASSGGYLSKYSEEIGEEKYSGVEIVNLISRYFSVNPQLLLALLEYQSGWLSNPEPDEVNRIYPMGWADPGRKDLYRQLAWAANQLNGGYYLWKINGLGAYTLADGTILRPDPTINAGTAAVQYLFSLLFDRQAFESAVSQDGFFAQFEKMFGYPFDYTYEVIPADLQQPPMHLPFSEGETWSFTGGPHGGWGDGSAWAAIDFAPPGKGKGCAESDAWVTAVADGKVIRVDTGVVILDLDTDGYEQTGWTVLYLHIATKDRVPLNALVKAGDRIGHPSCEGGVSNGTHVHLARRYNGEWIAADGPIPFNLDGWISAGYGTEYNGSMTRDGKVVEAWEIFTPANQISR